MRKISGMLLVLIGGFLVTLAVLALFFAPDRLMKTPLDVDTTTRLSGEVQLFNGTELETFPVKATSVTRTDTGLSDSDVASFANSSCLIKDEGDAPDCVSADDPQNRLISASTDWFATDRRSALAVNDPKYLPANAEPHEGLINKWPFEVEKKTYPYWDGLVGGTLDAEYVGTSQISGLETYEFNIQADDEPIEITDGVPGTYTSDKTIWVEPLTGSIIRQEERQVREMDDGQVVLDLALAFTDETVEGNVDAAQENRRSLNLVTTLVPPFAGVLGLLALVGGVLLLRRSGRHASA